MIRNAMLALTLTAGGVVLTSGDAPAQSRNRGATANSIYNLASPYLGNANVAPGIAPYLGNIFPNTGNSRSNFNGYGNGYSGNGVPQFQNSYRNGRYYGTPTPGYYNGATPDYYNSTSGYYTVPQTLGTTPPIPTQPTYAPAEVSQIATLAVQVPSADAQVWLNDTLTAPQGMDRQFQSPPLDPAKNYTYTVKARWMVDGKVMEKTRDVKAEPGKTSTVSFR